MKNNYIDKETGLVIVARQVLTIEYKDRPKSLAEGVNGDDIWKHDFKSKDVMILGLPDGSLWIRSKSGKKLWEFR